MTDFTPPRSEMTMIDNPAIHGLPPTGTQLIGVDGQPLTIGAYDARCDRAYLRYIDGSASWMPVCHVRALILRNTRESQST